MKTLRYNKQLIGVLLSTLVATGVSGCRKDKTTSSFKPLPTVYNPIGTQALNKLDILWVVDNSGSMAPYQANLAANFSSFISNFHSQGYDYKLAVTVSDAYRANTAANSNYYGGSASGANFKFVTSAGPAAVPTGSGQAGNLGCIAGYLPCTLNSPVITPLTADYLNTFIANAVVGTNGNGSERSMQSMREALSVGANAGFLRSDSFLAVIFITDELDSSKGYPTGAGGFSAAAAGGAVLDSYTSYVDYLDILTGTTGIYRRYNVSSITFTGSGCGTALQEYIDIATATNGVLGCVSDASYASALNTISTQINVLSTQFTLDHPAQPATIYVAFDGVPVPNNATNGWTYSSSLQAVQFHGTYTPTASTSIFIDYLPAY